VENVFSHRNRGVRRTKKRFGAGCSEFASASGLLLIKMWWARFNKWVRPTTLSTMG
jgi:hypothetical protein